jgi:MFS family permease
VRPLFASARPVAAGTQLTPEQVSAHIRHLIIEITWYGVLVGTTINLMQVYVVRLGASSLLVGAVTYGPALVGIFWQVPAAQWMRRSGQRMRFVIGSGLSHRLGYLAVALLPFFLPSHLPEFTVVVLVIQAFATALAATAFLALMADALPPDQVTQTVSWRMAGFGVTSTLSTLLAGLVLARLPFPLNYQVLFLAGFLTSLASQWNVAQVVVPALPAVRPIHSGWRSRLAGLGRMPRFAGFVGIASVLQMGLGMVVPLMPLFAVRHLGASDAQISLVVTMASAGLVIGSLVMRRVGQRAGRERVLAGTALGYLFYPLLLSLAPSVGWVIPCAAIGGFFTAGISVALFDNLVAVCPEGDKTSFFAAYNVCINIALFGGPLLAGVLAESASGPALGLRVAAAVCLLAALLTAAWMRRVP